MNSRVKFVLKILASLVIGFGLVWFDLYTKVLAVMLWKDQAPLKLIDGVLELTYLENKGAAFGMLQGKIPFFLIFTPIVAIGIAFVYVCLLRTQRFKGLRTCLLFLIAGAVGNFLDRVSLSYVRDFIYFRLINFPVFNVADIYVTCSVFVLAFLVLFVYKEKDFEEMTSLIKFWKKVD